MFVKHRFTDTEFLPGRSSQFGKLIFSFASRDSS